MLKRFCLPCFFGSLAVVAIAVLGTIFVVRRDQPDSSERLNGTVNENISSAAVIEYGKGLISDLNAAGADLSAGPCIDDAETFSDWVIDVSHDPREPVDDLPENQCASFRDGRTNNFVELTLSGTVIRTHEEP